MKDTDLRRIKEIEALMYDPKAQLSDQFWKDHPLTHENISYFSWYTQAITSLSDSLSSSKLKSIESEVWDHLQNQYYGVLQLIASSHATNKYSNFYKRYSSSFRKLCYQDNTPNPAAVLECQLPDIPPQICHQTTEIQNLFSNAVSLCDDQHVGVLISMAQKFLDRFEITEGKYNPLDVLLECFIQNKAQPTNDRLVLMAVFCALGFKPTDNLIDNQRSKLHLPSGENIKDIRGKREEKLHHLLNAFSQKTDAVQRIAQIFKQTFRSVRYSPYTSIMESSFVVLNLINQIDWQPFLKIITDNTTDIRETLDLILVIYSSIYRGKNQKTPKFLDQAFEPDLITSVRLVLSVVLDNQIDPTSGKAETADYIARLVALCTSKHLCAAAECDTISRKLLNINRDRTRSLLLASKMRPKVTLPTQDKPYSPLLRIWSVEPYSNAGTENLFNRIYSAQTNNQEIKAQWQANGRWLDKFPIKTFNNCEHQRQRIERVAFAIEYGVPPSDRPLGDDKLEINLYEIWMNCLATELQSDEMSIMSSSIPTARSQATTFIPSIQTTFSIDQFRWMFNELNDKMIFHFCKFIPPYTTIELGIDYDLYKPYEITLLLMKPTPSKTPGKDWVEKRSTYYKEQIQTLKSPILRDFFAVDVLDNDLHIGKIPQKFFWSFYSFHTQLTETLITIIKNKVIINDLDVNALCSKILCFCILTGDNQTAQKLVLLNTTILKTAVAIQYPWSTFIEPAPQTPLQMLVYLSHQKLIQTIVKHQSFSPLVKELQDIISTTRLLHEEMPDEVPVPNSPFLPESQKKSTYAQWKGYYEFVAKIQKKIPMYMIYQLLEEYQCQLYWPKSYISWPMNYYQGAASTNHNSFPGNDHDVWIFSHSDSFNLSRIDPKAFHENILSISTYHSASLFFPSIRQRLQDQTSSIKEIIGLGVQS